jgi:hypothetical protein
VTSAGGLLGALGSGGGLDLTAPVAIDIDAAFVPQVGIPSEPSAEVVLSGEGEGEDAPADSGEADPDLALIFDGSAGHDVSLPALPRAEGEQPDVSTLADEDLAVVVTLLAGGLPEELAPAEVGKALEWGMYPQAEAEELPFELDPEAALPNLRLHRSTSEQTDLGPALPAAPQRGSGDQVPADGVGQLADPPSAAANAQANPSAPADEPLAPVILDAGVAQPFVGALGAVALACWPRVAAGQREARPVVRPAPRRHDTPRQPID